MKKYLGAVVASCVNTTRTSKSANLKDQGELQGRLSLKGQSKETTWVHIECIYSTGYTKRFAQTVSLKVSLGKYFFPYFLCSFSLLGTKIRVYRGWAGGLSDICHGVPWKALVHAVTSPVDTLACVDTHGLLLPCQTGQDMSESQWRQQRRPKPKPLPMLDKNAYKIL